MSPPRESYVRHSIEHGPYTLEPAVEWRWGDSFHDVATKLELLATGAKLDAVTDPMTVAVRVAEGIKALWPDRAYFVEVWENDRPGFAQIVQPYGLPRDR